jgi:DNA-directed RNA polymerase beta' subunit
MVRKDILGRVINFSGRAVTVCDPSVKPYMINVSKKLLYKLLRLEFGYWLTHIKDYDYDWWFEEIVLSDYNDKKELFNEFCNWYFSENKDIVFFNRMPTLWRHGIPGMQINSNDEYDDTNVIGVNPLTLAPMNMDHDGDQGNIYKIHSKRGKKELKEKAWLMNTIFYDQTKKYLATLRHEALYAAFVLTYNVENLTKTEGQIIYDGTLDDLPMFVDLWNNKLYDLVKINGVITTYGNALFNKFAGFKQIKLNKTINKKQTQYVSDIIYKDSNSNQEYYDRYWKLENRLFYFITITKKTDTTLLSNLL